MADMRAVWWRVNEFAYGYCSLQIFRSDLSMHQIGSTRLSCLFSASVHVQVSTKLRGSKLVENRETKM